VEVKYYYIWNIRLQDVIITECRVGTKLGDYFYLAMFVDSSLMQWFYICNGVTLGLWMLSVRSLLTFLRQHLYSKYYVLKFGCFQFFCYIL
jgi:hypothetical protein